MVTRKKVKYHFKPPRKIAVTRFEQQRVIVLALLVLFAVFALSFGSFFSDNLVGFATVNVKGTPYSVSVDPDAEGNNLNVMVNVDNNKINGVYLELGIEKYNICSKLSTTAVKNHLWKDFQTITCEPGKGLLVFADATVNSDSTIQTSKKVALFSFPIVDNELRKKPFKVYITPLDVYETMGGTDLFPDDPAYFFDISLSAGKCGDTVCNAGETAASCASDCGPKAECGNGVCEAVAGETEASCAKDCKKITNLCGNGKCDSSETTVNCPGDCPADKGVQTASGGSVSGGGSKSGSGPGCVPEWSCGSWGACNNTKQQSRKCNDVGKQCKKPNVKIENQSCVCQESWQCSAWSSCVSGKNTRKCTDERKCGTVLSKPAESKGCAEKVPEYVPQQQTYQPPMKPQEQKKIEPVEQKPEPTSWEKYKEWIVGIPMLLLFITLLVIAVLHYTKKQPQVTFNYEELKDWIKKERAAGTTDADIEVILAQNTGWTKEEVEKIFAEMKSGQKVEMPKTAS